VAVDDAETESDSECDRECESVRVRVSESESRRWGRGRASVQQVAGMAGLTGLPQPGTQPEQGSRSEGARGARLEEISKMR